MKFTKYLDADKKFNVLGALGTILCFLGVPQLLGGVGAGVHTILGAVVHFLFF
jgi:hypothetical protein